MTIRSAADKNAPSLSLPEAVILLALDADTGQRRPIPVSAFELAMAGAALLELALRNVLDNDIEHIELMPAGVGQPPPALDPLVHLLASQPRPLRIEAALALAALDGTRAADEMTEQLVERGLLAPAGRGFRAGAYQVRDWAVFRALRRRIRIAVMEDELPDPRDLALISLLAATGLVEILFTAEEWTARATRVDQLLRMELIGQAMLRALRAVKPGTQAAIAAPLLGIDPHGPSAAAGGLPALTSAMGHVYRALGLRRGVLALRQMNQPGGFDCSGCAWPESAHTREAMDFCENGAKALASDATRRTLDADFFARWSLEDLAGQSDYWLEQQGRLVTPMVRRDGDSHYRPTSYEDAYAVIAEQLRGLSSPAEAVFYTCGHAVNEAAFLFQLCARQFGTPHLPSSINLCHEPSGRALFDALGHAKGDARMEDFAQADAIFLFGHNPGSNHPRMLRVLEAAARRGARILAINPLLEAGLNAFANPRQAAGLLGQAQPLLSLHLPVRIGGDLALLKGLIKHVLEAEAQDPGQVLDWPFIREYTADFESFAARIAETSWEEITAASGLSFKMIEQAARIFIEARHVVVSWGLGLTQHTHGYDSLRELINLMLLRGHVGRPGSGLCPMRGHSNILGIRSMGAGERMSDAFLVGLEEATGLRLSRQPGWHAVAAIEAMARGEARALLSLGGNLAAAAPDTPATLAALGRCALTVQIGTKLNRSHLAAGRTAVILPCLARSEREEIGGKLQVGLIEDMMAEVKPSRGVLKPIHSGIRGETRIVAELAAALHGDSPALPWSVLAGDYSAVRRLIGRAIPDYDQAVDWAQEKATVRLPNPLRSRDFSSIGGRARFAVTAWHTPPPSAPDVFQLMTIRSHDQLNTAIHGLDDRYRGIRHARRVVLMNAEDMQCLGISAEQPVQLRRLDANPRQQPVIYHAVPYPIPTGCAAAYFPEANALTDLRARDRATGTPASKAAKVRIAPA
jgi:molybdopterin-dependent oxidoreductase alpha subunit